MAKQEYVIKDKDSAMEFCNKMMAYVMSPKFQPMSIEADFGKGSSDSQREYYWAVIIEEQYKYFKEDILKFVEYLFKIIRGGLLDRQMIHQINKLLYNNGRSSERLDTSAREKYHEKILDDMFHICRVRIAKPNETMTKD